MPGPALSCMGLIPAHAGSTWFYVDAPGLLRAHPRSRGEHDLRMPFTYGAAGSSPLTRGAPWSQITLTLGVGLIPAHAGSTSTSPDRRPRAAAHPRSRGEHDWLHTNRLSQGGSSPLTRGALHPAEAAYMAARLIPAHAGSTLFSAGIGSLFRAHPRSRGEHFTSVTKPWFSRGSSPLTRGAHGGRPHRVQPLRLIPAHAGSTAPHLSGT